MKTKEVIKEIEKMGLQTKIGETCLFVIHPNGGAVASVNLDRKFKTDFDFWDFNSNLSENEREKVYFLLTRLAETDPEDREEQRFYLKHKWLKCEYWNYLSVYIADGFFELKNMPNTAAHKTQFTQSEIDEIKRKFNTSLEDFEQVPVEEEMSRD